MKTTLTLLAAMAAAVPAMAETAPAGDFAGVPALSTQRLSGVVVAGVDTNYVGRGIVISHSVAEGDGSEFVAVKLNYDFGKQKKYWSMDSAISYRAVHSGHTLYGNPQVSNAKKIQGVAAAMGITEEQLLASGFNPNQFDKNIKECNLENEFSVRTSINYTREKWNASFGHTFVHGGILGVMAKHYRDQGASCTNEVFLKLAATPTPWLDLGVTADFSFQGITGWWFEPYVTLQAPIIGTPEDVKVAGRLTFALSATAEYFNEGYFACANGTQAFWIKLETPWFVNKSKSLVVVPYVSFNWLGKGALKANKGSEFRHYSGCSDNVPFRNFGVVGGIGVMYKF